MIRGHFGIGCINMKNNFNYGSLFRTANLLGADYLYLIGKRFKPQSSDTMKSHRHIPTYHYDTFKQFQKNLPIGTHLVGIELDESATPIFEYKHPAQACYLLGAEDSGLTKEAMNNCVDLIVLPGERSMNVAVAGSIVLYDRIAKLR